MLQQVTPAKNVSRPSPSHGRRYATVTKEKSDGATYTPVALASFVAVEVLKAASIPSSGVIRILDPAVGDGALLSAILHCLPKSVLSRCEIYGFETNPLALSQAKSRLLTEYGSLTFHLVQRDFLAYILGDDNSTDLFAECVPASLFHLVIANPPYVRTQIIGAKEAQRIAASFGLTGRVDLYYPFMLGISKILAPGGAAGIITSNRFMSTKSGQSVRREILSRFSVSKVFDLGDTKIFSAAVLPSVLIAKGIAEPQQPDASGVAFSSIYECQEPTATVSLADDLYDAIARGTGVYTIPDGRKFVVKSGSLDNGSTAEGVWRVASHSTDNWLATAEAHTWATFERIGKIRVGVKSTADKVFIRSDWNTLHSGIPELLRPLITRQNANRYKARKPKKGKQDKWILYTHEVRNGKRAAVDLSLYPKSAEYLEAHRSTLEARDYVIKAGRCWFELWVPQNPDAWAETKMVFPDISEKPTFWIDTDGGVVNGECYWLRCADGSPQDWLWLACAVANSSFIEVFYDHKFNNKLYSGRRRFITQYVEKFPLPDPELALSKEIVQLAKHIHNVTPSADADACAAHLDELVWSAFGLNPEKIST